MKAWEAVKLCQEGNVLEFNFKQLSITDGHFLKLENKLDDSYVAFPLMELEKDWQIKRESILFEKAIEYMRQGRVCECETMLFRIKDSELELLDTTIDGIKWARFINSVNYLLEKEWYLLPEEK